jgi:hypothetical protein
MARRSRSGRSCRRTATACARELSPSMLRYFTDVDRSQGVVEVVAELQE